MSDANLIISRDRDPEVASASEIDIDKIPSLMCWSYSVARVCLISWQNNEIVLGVYLSEILLKTIKLRANECKLIEEGDFIKLKANICLDVPQRAVTAKGYVRIAGERFNFDGVILNF